jgi:hypothetical protein
MSLRILFFVLPEFCIDLAAVVPLDTNVGPVKWAQPSENWQYLSDAFLKHSSLNGLEPRLSEQR